MKDIHRPTPSLLTKTELEWLMGKKKVSKVYEYRIRCDIKKKLQIFQTSELPLLVQNGFIHELSVFSQLSANTQNNSTELSLANNHNTNENHPLPTKSIALGGNSRMFPHFWTRDLFLTKETLYQAELPRHREFIYN